MSSSILRPGISLGLYPEKSRDLKTSKISAHKPWTPQLSRAKLRNVARDVGSAGERLVNLDSNTLRQELQDIRYELVTHGLEDDLIISAFALVREFSSRTLNMKHHDVQVMGGWAMIHGAIAEMETGEGKTLTATLAAATAALAKIPVHVITVNDYLAQRDAASMHVLYRALGLSVGCVTQTTPENERRVAYDRDVTYCSNKQLAFDYLRDRIKLKAGGSRLHHLLAQLGEQSGASEGTFLRGLCFAIVDEADSVLVDEAKTPLVIAKDVQQEDEEKTYRRALALARTLINGVDFSIDTKRRVAIMTEHGRDKLSVLTVSLGGVWHAAQRREHLVKTALEAQALYQRDQHYLVRDGKIEIVDESTGRTTADRAWQNGLHQMIELKERCPMTGQRETLAQITYQRFFRRYLLLGGMSGTVRELDRELRSVYGLRTVVIPTHKPCLRKSSGTRVFANRSAKYRALAARAHKIHQLGRPILIGTRTVEDSDLISAMLTKLGLPHHVLNARQDKNEAEIIAKAGETGSITVATNMAGRGTDIKLGRDVEKLGGLHVICMELNDARRIDRQLHGRCARQGDPGSVETLLSLDDRDARTMYPQWLIRGLRKGINKGVLPNWLLARLLRLPQYLQERHNATLRRALLKVDEQIGKYLAFSGKQE